MSKRTKFRHALALLMLFTGCNASAQAAESFYSSPSGVVQVQGLVSAFDPHSGLATVGDVAVYVGDVIVELGLSLNVGDDIAVVGNFVESAGFLFAINVEYVLQRSPKALGAAKKQSITGTGKQSSASLNKASTTGTGISLQSITGTGKQSSASLSKVSITGTGISLQSITGTGKQSSASLSKASITGTGIGLQSITGTGKQSSASLSKASITGTGISLQSITGTGKQSVTGTGTSSQSITGTGIRTLSITGTGALE